ncbi:MAG: Gfo/Idh/MocA family oxidoreductase [Chloroflexi bacterium]|nr:Gfo/Idh/MocA family oxidoreductase [Chloroflexota bacterium]
MGWLGESLVKELSRFPRLRLAAVQDADPELAAEIAARYGSPRHGTDYEALVATPDVDVVVICTPNWLHGEQARAALRVGKHVLVQKPLALTPMDARATVDLAARVGKLLVVDYSYRYLETVRSLRVALPDIGRVERVTATFHNIYGPSNRWPFEPRLSGGGALIDLGVHLLDLGLDALRPRRVRLEAAELSFARGYPVEDAARILVRLDEVPMTVEVSWNADRPLADISLQVDGERGRLRWENVAGSFFHFRSLRNRVLLLDRETTLRADTLEELDRALTRGAAPPIHLEVYDLLAEAYRSIGARIMGPAPEC